MAYSNDTTQIKQGMVNYVGALIKASKFPPKGARQDVSAMLIEEALKLARTEDGQYDMYVLKPLLRAVETVSQNRMNALYDQVSHLPKEVKKEAEKTLEDYQLLHSASKRLLSTVHNNAN